MKKKILSALLCIVMVGTMLVGCSSGNKEKAEGSTGESSGGTKEVVIWDYFETDAQKSMMTTLIDGFNESQDEFEAKHVYVPFSDYEKQLTLGIASGELPDIVIMDGCGMTSFISMDLFGDISDADINWDEYTQGPLETTMLDGKHYGIPFAANCTALFYNKDLFDAAGVEYPTDETTWDEFREMAKALTKDGVTGFGNAAVGTDEGTFQCLQWLYTAGGSYEDVTGGEDAYKLMQEMVAEGSWTKDSVNWTQSDVNNNFIAGNIAMQQNGPWQIPGIAAEVPDMNYGVVPLPRRDADAEQATSIIGGESMGVVKKDDTSGAVAFLKYYDQTEVMVAAMKEYGSFPPKTEAAADSYWMDDPIQSEFIKQLETSIPRGPSPIWPSYSAALQKGFQEALTSAKTPEKVVEDTQSAVEAVK
ncbi:multiple sugar transport system substrate-binding protein [Aequitasia blattaphilus]|uniref:ABC transporter substrate-binding protein n=1 Tax=Aequitasia blattaphilus TaxID=2949332 RepID=A0ABT1ECE1_9FIRM|nr:ABC transporter substrate-binding protein [Aequitasia blattaphilus]MCP1103519.1 ABC transporter substrate-binding protein [Aequitasia blattaphilus]MCR8616159.1 ABC transporter substrate-binding protein [Aequitasia blattaphilus]